MPAVTRFGARRHAAIRSTGEQQDNQQESDEFTRHCIEYASSSAELEMTKGADQARMRPQEKVSRRTSTPLLEAKSGR